MKKSIIVPVLAVVTASAVALGASQVSAQSLESEGGTSIIERIATRFNLNQEDVKAVFNEEREAHMAEMQQQNENRLDEAIAAGELTEEQKQLILSKQAELKAEMETEMNTDRESFKDMTDEERQAAMQAKRDAMEARQEELKSWAEANGIDMKYLMVRAKFHGGGPGGGFKMMRTSSPDGNSEDVVIEATPEATAL